MEVYSLGKRMDNTLSIKIKKLLLSACACGFYGLESGKKLNVFFVCVF